MHYLKMLETKMLKPADVVCLKSGGFKMTVSDSTETHAKCIWHDKEGVLHEESFSIDLLEIAESKSGMLCRPRK
ncbi:DUF2158 domain-containing protein [Salmonella enterica subsp. enterica serovar Derby]|uniref:DUF2158 domain-containing protein n=17 Tax=root TaxID=1 RepID=A0A8T9CLU8_ECOLX|nr:DUF2158 domain-containing protein [Escherichia coli]AXD59895.1 DUF2158 domain-containing protein [Salmonella enterica]EAA0826253.1 DUF2158 domain-containing protein [Salmonella enterica subsp. enterica serovar Agona]EAA1779288.1 DUF2158 domain-containing protein [Salmonella enterica subsp. enterica]EAA7328138.1 DUF2158 domain-containing protein [Salmonella enterica subsp. enterica serovar Typhimurium]EAB0294290.1 DUF2158 domain-containing protein [Salmonella enterica subsp. enterica serovar